MSHAPMKTHRRTTLFVLTAALGLLVALVALPTGPASAQAPVPAPVSAQPANKSGLFGSLFRAASVEDLLGHKFVSTKVKGRKMAGKKVHLEFFLHSPTPDKPEKPTLAAGAGCNAMGATFVTKNGRLRWKGRFMSTAMGCPKHNHDAWLRRLLKRGMNAELSGKRLVLTRGKTRIALRQVK